MAADDGKTNNTIIERFFSLKSFIEELSDSPNNHDDNVKRFNEMLNSLPRDQINIYTTDSQRNTLLHIALEEDVEWAAETLLEAGASVSEKDFLGCQPLHTACKTGDHSLVRLLLNHNADIQAEDNYGWSPLHYASYSGDESSVELLLKLGAKPLVLSMYGKTPFHLAVEGGYTEMVKMFLDKNMLFRVNVNARGVQKKTALHHAASSGHEEVIKALIDKGAKIGLKDTAGNTPLMTATRMGKLGSMNTLLALCGYNQANISDNTGKTPLLVAIEDENLGPLDILLKYWPDENKRNPAVYQKLLSYKGLTPTEGILKMQKSILDALENDQEAFDEALFWAATKFERHEIAKELLTRNLYLETNQFSAIELATQQQKPDVLWFLIATSPSTHKITESIKSAKAKAEETDAGGYQTDVMKHIIDILEDPPIAQLYKDDDISGPPRLRFEHSGPVKEFKALIARFYKANHVSGTIRKTRNVKNTVYGKGPTKIMTGAMSNLKNIMGGSFDNKDDDAKSSQLRATYGKDNLRFTYIHLPATNIDWMKDLLLKIVDDEEKNNITANYYEVSSFLQSTWFEIPYRTSELRITRPKFAERIPIVSTSKKQSEEYEGITIDDAQHVEDQEDDGFIPCSALYMPFLVFGTQTEDPEDAHPGPGKKSKRLIEAYKSSIVHSSATLDEAYYHFKPGNKQAQDDRDRRSRTQVVTKQSKQNDKMLEGGQQPSNGQMSEDNRAKSWPMLRVSQIWIWTIDNKWVMSAASHSVDDVEQSWLEGFTAHLNKQIEAGGAQFQPGSTKDMMKTIVDYCIGSYERGRTYRDPSHQDSNNDWHTGPSIRELFSDYINCIERKETSLFDHVQRLENGSSTFGRENNFKEVTIKAEELFSEIKDVRDELGIIKAIINYQDIVQQGLFGGDLTNSGLTASYILNDIADMESRASRVQSAASYASLQGS